MKINAFRKGYNALRRVVTEIPTLINNLQFGVDLAILTYLSHVIPFKKIRECCSDRICLFIKSMNIDLIEKANSQSGDYNKNQENLPYNPFVWVCWFTGYNNSPPIVKACINSIKKALPEDAQFKLITMENYGKYIDIPEYIIEKYKDGKISNAAFSDIIRACLLSKYGGMWLDATIWVSGSIDSSVLSADYYTLKSKRSLLYYKDPSEGLWCNFIWVCKTNNCLLTFLREALFNYWKEYDTAIEYLLPDYIIRVAYQNIGCVNKMINEFPSNIEDIWLCMNNMETIYTGELEEQIIRNSIFNKITYKSQWATSINGRATLYGYILNN